MIKNEGQKMRDNAYFAMFDREINSPLNERNGEISLLDEDDKHTEGEGIQFSTMFAVVCFVLWMLYIVFHVLCVLYIAAQDLGIIE
jgi:hypothetical protein